ncbi:MAG: hypothetical protein ACRD4H_12745 [Candidatus Acidiferrales bacterium]
MEQRTTQLVWKIGVLATTTPAKPHPHQSATDIVMFGHAHYDALCAKINYALLDKDGYILKSGQFWVPTETTRETSVQAEDWVLYDIAARTTKAQAQLSNISWRTSCQ